MATPAFRSEQQESRGDGQYRSVSVLAVCGLVLGLLSVAALAHPGAWVFPGLAITFCLLALIRIGQQSDVLSGRKLAVAGLLLGLFFGVWATTRYFSERWIVTEQAQDFVEDWLQAVLDGDLESAHQATLEFYLREPEGTRLKEYYANDSEQLSLLQEYFSEGMAKTLADLGERGEFRFDRTMLRRKELDSQIIGLRYFIYPRGGDVPIVCLHIEALMDLRDDGVYWTILGIDDADIIDRRRTYSSR